MHITHNTQHHTRPTLLTDINSMCIRRTPTLVQVPVPPPLPPLISCLPRKHHKEASRERSTASRHNRGQEKCMKAWTKLHCVDLLMVSVLMVHPTIQLLSVHNVLDVWHVLSLGVLVVERAHAQLFLGPSYLSLEVSSHGPDSSGMSTQVPPFQVQSRVRISPIQCPLPYTRPTMGCVLQNPSLHSVVASGGWHKFGSLRLSVITLISCYSFRFLPCICLSALVQSEWPCMRAMRCLADVCLARRGADFGLPSGRSLSCLFRPRMSLSICATNANRCFCSCACLGT